MLDHLSDDQVLSQLREFVRDGWFEGCGYDPLDQSPQEMREDLARCLED